MEMRGPITVLGMASLAALLAACAGAGDDCSGDADCPAGSSCVKNGGHLVCLADDGGLGGGGSGGAGGSGGMGGTGGAGGTGGTCPDADGDEVCDDVDRCPSVADPGQEDGDSDGLGDACDPCPADAANDADGDGVCGDVDNCPDLANAGQENLDDDPLGDACDTDVDGDGALEADDCAPRDPAVYPGAADPCDGTDTDCVPGRCAMVLISEVGWATRDVICASGTRSCAVALRGPDESGRVTTLALENTPQVSDSFPASGVIGIAIDPNPTNPLLLVTTLSSIRAYAPDGFLAYELHAEAQTLNGSGAVSVFRTAAVALHSSASNAQFFSPAEIDSTGNPPLAVQCQPSSLACRLVSLRNIGPVSSPLGLKSPAAVTARQVSESAPIHAYISFVDDNRLGVAVIGIDGALHGSASRLLDCLPTANAVLALSPDGTELYGIDRAGHGALISTTSYSWQPFDLSACPTVLVARDADLLIVSQCGAEPAELIALPVIDGLPDESTAVTTPLPNCTPHRMAGSPQLGTDGPDAVLIGCEGTATVLVLGRD